MLLKMERTSTCHAFYSRLPPTWVGQGWVRFVLCGWLPHCKGDFQVWRVGRVQSSVRPVGAAAKGLLALMESANRVPFCLSGCDAFDKTRVVPVPGLTGLAITSRRSRNLLKLILPAKPWRPKLPALAHGISGRPHPAS